MNTGGYTYILQSQKHRHYYVGSCADFFTRMIDHERGNTKTTRNQGPWVVCYIETYPTLAGARTKEREIKKRKSKKTIEKLINSAW